MPKHAQKNIIQYGMTIVTFQLIKKHVVRVRNLPNDGVFNLLYLNLKL